MKKLFKFLIPVTLSLSVVSNVFAMEDLLKKAREFVTMTGSTIDENREFIIELNQISLEAEVNPAQKAELELFKAILFSRMNDVKSATESFSSSINSGLLPPLLKAEAHKNRGLLYYKTRLYNSAVMDFRAAIQILKGNSELHYYLANSLFGMLKFEEAIKEYDIALEGMSSKRFLAYYGKGSVYFQQQKFEKSREFLNLSLKEYAQFKPAQNLLGELDKLEAKAAEVVPEMADPKKMKPPKNSNQSVADIYNQLMSQALAARNKSGNEDKKSFKFEFNVDGQEKSKVELREQSTLDLSQISVNPFIISSEAQKNRLNALLEEDKLPQIKGYAVQLSSSENKEKAQISFDRALKKHYVLIKNKPYIIRQFRQASGNLVYQTLLIDFASYKQASSLCQMIKEGSTDCFVRKLN